MLDQVQINIDSNLHSVDQIIAYLSKDEDAPAFLRVKDYYERSAWTFETRARLKMKPYFTSNEMYRIARYPLSSAAI